VNELEQIEYGRPRDVDRDDYIAVADEALPLVDCLRRRVEADLKIAQERSVNRYDVRSIRSLWHQLTSYEAGKHYFPDAKIYAARRDDE